MIEDQLLEDFTDLLGERFSSNIMTSEDSIRYLFFHTLTKDQKISPNQIIQEYPHPCIPRARIDTFIPEYESKGYAFEFKYHRRSASVPESMSAGELFKDFFRLRSLKEMDRKIDCYVVYVTDKTMDIYFKNQDSVLNKWYSSAGEQIELKKEDFVNLPKTFLDAAGEIRSCRIWNIFKKDIDGENMLIVTKVLEN